MNVHFFSLFLFIYLPFSDSGLKICLLKKKLHFLK